MCVVYMCVCVSIILKEHVTQCSSSVARWGVYFLMVMLRYDNDISARIRLLKFSDISNRQVLRQPNAISYWFPMTIKSSLSSCPQDAIWRTKMFHVSFIPSATYELIVYIHHIALWLLYLHFSWTFALLHSDVYFPALTLCIYIVLKSLCMCFFFFFLCRPWLQNRFPFAE